MKRRVPRPSELAPLLGFRKPQLNTTKRRLQSALTIEDLRRIAKRRTPKAAFDYTDGAAEDELSLARARQAFQDIEFPKREIYFHRPSVRHPAALPAVPGSAV